MLTKRREARQSEIKAKVKLRQPYAECHYDATAGEYHVVLGRSLCKVLGRGRTEQDAWFNALEKLNK